MRDNSIFGLVTSTARLKDNGRKKIKDFRTSNIMCTQHIMLKAEILAALFFFSMKCFIYFGNIFAVYSIKINIHYLIQIK